MKKEPQYRIDQFIEEGGHKRGRSFVPQDLSEFIT